MGRQFSPEGGKEVSINPCSTYCTIKTYLSLITSYFAPQDGSVALQGWFKHENEKIRFLTFPDIKWYVHALVFFRTWSGMYTYLFFCIVLPALYVPGIKHFVGHTRVPSPPPGALRVQRWIPSMLSICMITRFPRA